MRPILTAANRFTGVALIFGIAFIIITPPFQAPDEVAHFYRIYQMSEGRLKPENFLLGIGGDLPTTVRKVSREMFDNVRFHPENKIDLSLFMKTLNTKINPEDRAVTFFANTAHYPPLVYLPQTLGVVLARLFSLNMFAIFYTGRLLNLLVYIYLMRAAINLTPSGKEVFGLIGLMPMAIFQAASLSSDMMTNAVGVLFVGYILNGYDKSETYSLKWLTGLWFMVMLLLFVKPGYYPLLILVFTLPFYKRYQPFSVAAILVLIIAMPFAFHLAWRSSIADIIHFRSGVDPAGQLSMIWNNQNDLAFRFAKSLIKQIPGYISSFIGILGWYDTFIPWCFKGPYLGLMILTAWIGPGDRFILRGWQKLVFLGIGALNFLLIIMVLILTWTKVGSTFIDGVQGRYFIPLAPLFFLPLQSCKSTIRNYLRDDRLYGWILTGSIAIILTGSLAFTWLRYYGSIA